MFEFFITKSILIFSSFTILAYTFYTLRKKYKYSFRNTLKDSQTVILSNKTSNLNEFDTIILSHINEHPVLGFDCEWINEGKRRKPVALLQIATYKHFCLLIRLCDLTEIPDLIKQILDDSDILKIGVAPLQDAKFLYEDYNLIVNGCVDLRHFTREPYGLAALAEKYLNFKMNKNWRLRCGDWEAENLNEEQITYASYDVLVAVELFKKIVGNKNNVPISYIDVPFCMKSNNRNETIGKGKRKINKQKPYKILTLKKPLYSNCYMQAPDGELLCTCDKKKAEWYLDKKLATLISEEPFMIRINFEPAGRAVGEVGKYYTSAKVNKCVVCGRADSYIRKNIVPREYRKLFPVVMKDHTSHDVLLLCIHCHQKSNIADNVLREKLAKLCEAPIRANRDVKFFDFPAARELKSAARALLRNADQIPEKRKQELREIVLKYFPGRTEIDDSMLQAVHSLDTSIQNEDYEPHGQKVVDYFIKKCKRENQNEFSTGGLTELEQMWRQHFLDTMKPKYLPPLWSVTHNKVRLELRAEEGRIELEDLRKAGCNEKLLRT